MSHPARVPDPPSLRERDHPGRGSHRPPPQPNDSSLLAPKILPFLHLPRLSADHYLSGTVYPVVHPKSAERTLAREGFLSRLLRPVGLYLLQITDLGGLVRADCRDPYRLGDSGWHS